MTALDLPPLWTLASVVLAWGLARMDPLRFEGAPLIALALLAIAAAMMIWAAYTMARARTPVMPNRMPERLVTSGPFRFSRNPIYLADLIVVCAAALWLGSPLALCLVPALGWVLTRRFIKGEEQRLADLAPLEWQAYAKRTGRWLFR